MLPVETIRAVFPSSVRVGGIQLGPMTLLHAVALEAVGVDLDAEIGEDRAYCAAWILAQNADETRKIGKFGLFGMAARFAKWAKGFHAPVDETLAAVRRCVRDAFECHVPGKSDRRQWQAKSGFGWEIEVAEAICAEHGRDFDEVIEMPLARTFALLACARKRNGGDFDGDDYFQRIQAREAKAIMAEMKRKRAEAKAASEAKAYAESKEAKTNENGKEGI